MRDMLGELARALAALEGGGLTGAAVDAAAAALAASDAPGPVSRDLAAMLSSLRLVAASPALGPALADELREDFVFLVRTAERDALVTRAEAVEVLAVLDATPP